MSPDQKPRSKPDLLPDAPGLEQQNWDDIIRGGPAPVDETDSDVPFEEDPDGDLPEEDDDNAYQESDEALPDDAEERTIRRNPSREDGVFDET